VTIQGSGALKALNALDWPVDAALDQAQITTGCALDYVRVTAPDLMPVGRYQNLESLLGHLLVRPEFFATTFNELNRPGFAGG